MHARSRLGVVVAILFVGGLVAGVGGALVFGPNTGGYDAPRSVYIARGTTLDAAIDSLAQADVLVVPAAFRLVARATGWGQQIKSGHYRIAPRRSNYALLDKLRRGLQDPVRVTIPPGVQPGALTSVLGQRVKRGFDRFYERELAAGAERLGLTKREVVTLASIVEWEALLDAEKPAIAGVYLNRLDRGWPLQADPTIQYVLLDTKGERVTRVLYEHLEIDHPYNTYQNQGLPPGPITNPSPSSLRAAARPERHEYLYFAADGTGGHTFSRTLREHNRAAEKYQRRFDDE